MSAVKSGHAAVRKAGLLRANSDYSRHQFGLTLYANACRSLIWSRLINFPNYHPDGAHQAAA
jgi:hypothetical protein